MALVVDEFRQTRDAMRYGFAVGKARVLETRALDRSALERLLDARTFEEQKRLLSETAYAPYLESAHTPGEVERALDDALDGFYGFLEDAALPEPVVRFFRLRYDYANLKAALKARLFGADLEELLVDHGTVPLDVFRQMSELPEHLSTVASDLAGAGDGDVIDREVDRAYFADLLATARRSRSRFLSEIAEIQIDAANVKTLVRGTLSGLAEAELAGLFLDGGTVSAEELAALFRMGLADLPHAIRRHAALRALAATGFTDPAELDPALQMVQAAALRRGRQEAAGPEPVIAYVMGREAEVRMLRVLLLGTLTGVAHETLRARLNAAMG